MKKFSGLTLEEVKIRKEQNKINKEVKVQLATIPQIIFKNTFTMFNLLNLFLAFLLILIREYKNLLFLGVVIINTVISTAHEISAKKITDKLQFLKKQKITCIRENKESLIDSEKLVLDDIIKLSNNNVIPADCKILDGEVEVNESLLTGEEDIITKKARDVLLSGSYIISGEVIAKIIHVGIDNYANKIVIDSKYIKKNQSTIIKSLNKIIKFMAFLIVPLGLLLFFKQFNISNNLAQSITNTVAAIIGMIPKGLILLTSSVFALGIIRLSKYSVLIKNLYSIENLSRVDTLCLDKTGTLTKGNITLNKVLYLHSNKKKVDEMLNLFISNSINLNKTTLAIQRKYNKIVKANTIKRYNFSSDRKFSGLTVDNYGTILLGAPEILTMDNNILTLSSEYSKNYRCLLLAYTNANYDFSKINIKKIKIDNMALILLDDELRDNVYEVIKYLYNQNVDIKIITGDNVMTTMKIAKKCGIKNYENALDMSKVKNNNELNEIISNNTIFARVSPFQKKDIIKKIKENHKVAYIGDGTNDVMALKESDFSLTFDNASNEAKNVSDAILINSAFSGIPKIIKEGRREINNLERSASLFLIKTIYSLLLSIIFLFVNKPYPFIPIQLTLISALTIGVPSFILALENNDNSRIKDNFLINIFKNALAPSLTIVTNILLIILSSHIFNFDYKIMSTMCVVLTGLTGFTYLYTLCVPFNKFRVILYLFVTSSFLTSILFLKGIFSLAYIPFKCLIIILILFVLSVIIFDIYSLLIKRILTKLKKI